VSGALWQYLQSSLQFKKYRRNEFFLKEGQVNKYAWFLSAGLVRVWYKQGEREVTFRLLPEGNIISEGISLNDQASSRYNIQALEDCETLYITYNDVLHLSRNYPEYVTLSLKLSEWNHELSESRRQLLYIKSMGERYQLLLRSQGSLCNRVPVKYLASYLGMESNTLSIIRKRQF
jgi:CRP-like cAMP-binding protein